MATNQVQSRKLVHGYIRKIKLSPLYYLFSIVPSDIKSIVEMYQQKYACDDKWDNAISSQDITITEDTDKYIIKMDKNHDSTAFGHNIISQGIAKWRLQILSLTCSWGEPPYIGIIEDDTNNLQMYQENSNWYDKGYQLSIGDGKIISAFTINHKVSANIDIGTVRDNTKMAPARDLKEADIIDIELNLYERSLTFTFISQGKDDLVITIENIKLTKYRLALCGLFCKSSQFALLK
mmetsp:Transcript_55782/g.50187  ORF Transcript_55782/g.50187 Transcript_55782/m.50187 type:complete len:236 (-) Transcript_55782:374-1081(-)